MTVALVLVSHSAALARGVAELAAQMAPSVTILAAGGGDDGGLGTSFELISDALQRADNPDGTVVLYDLGSAVLTTETAVEFLDPQDADRITVIDAPLVEGTIAAAVTAEGAGDRAAVAASARSAIGSFGAGPDGAAAVEQVAAGDEGAGEEVAGGSSVPSGGFGADQDDADIPAGIPDSADVEVVNPLGLHARPAAELARSLAGTSATVRIGRPGGPAVDLRSVLGVVGLAVRGGDDVRINVWGPDAILVLGRLVKLVRGGFGEIAHHRAATVVTRPEPSARMVDGVVTATAGSPGRAIGPLARLDALPETLPATADPAPRTGRDRDIEEHRLDSAIAAAAKTLAGQGEFGQAHAALVADPKLRALTEQKLERGAPAAWWDTVVQISRELEASDDELIASRGIDLREAGVAVLGELGVHLDRIPDDLRGAVVLAGELGPAEIPELVGRGAVAAVLATGSTTAHAVIVARGLGLPMVIRSGDVLQSVATGTTLVVDGDTGTVLVDPPREQREEIVSSIAEQAAVAERLRGEARRPVVLAGGREVLVAANVGSVADAIAAVDNGADGIGLLRTELLVLDRDEYPDEDLQTANLVEILHPMGDRPVVIRALDVGGDKPLATLDVDARRNGFLGVRGLRFLLENPEILRTQLRAICRASFGHHVSVMAPMVTVPHEAKQWREAVASAVDSLRADRLEFAVPEQVGIMVEVPAAALAADGFAGLVDFFSVGSNDLTSYTMAADRTEPGVADLLDPGSIAIRRLLEQLCAAAAAAHIPVAVCGEMAGMDAFAVDLVRLGVGELSMAPARIPQIKALLRETLGGPAGVAAGEAPDAEE
ncbi:dihydroxyacetone kinase phosphoryl donor subunit DhaM [Nakamurella sp. A5-74]|uniref:Phosphocarrier protein HPr n=1 Tax=Nakamurella sp. A5-74 TaxID=3158264 RepID=A0AAU8DT93_9ACTN